MSFDDMARQLARHFDIDKKLPSALLSYDVAIPAYEFICLYLCVQIIHELKPDKDGFYSLPVKLARMLTGEHGKNNDYRRLDQAIDFLADQSIKWNVAREDKTVDSFRASFIATKRVNSKNRNPHFRINSDIEKLIKNTKVFSPMNLLMLAVFSHMRTAYPFYVFLNDAHARGATELFMSIKQLKILFGVGEKEYEGAFKHFNQVHIKPKCTFLQNYSDITFEHENYREGRKVAGIRITQLRKQEFQQVLFSREGEDFNFIEEIVELAHEINSTLKEGVDGGATDQYVRRLVNPESSIIEDLGDLSARYKKYGVGLKKLTTLIDEPAVGIRGLREILDTCEADIEKRSKTKNKINSPSKHVFWAISKGWKEDNYGLKTPTEREKEDHAQQKLSEQRERNRETFRLALTHARLLKEHQASLSNLHDRLIEKIIACSDYEEITNEFEQTLKQGFFVKSFQEKKWSSPLLRQQVIDFLAPKFQMDIPEFGYNQSQDLDKIKLAYKTAESGVFRDAFQKSEKLDLSTDQKIMKIVDTYFPKIGS